MGWAGNMGWAGSTSETLVTANFWVNDDNTVVIPSFLIPQTMNISDLDIVSTTDQDKWSAVVTARVVNALGEPVSNAKVSGTWSFGVDKNCTTDLSGLCQITTGDYNGEVVGILAFTVTNIEKNGMSYIPARNIDFDGDSDGTTISVNRPSATSMYVADISGVNTATGSKWYTTITVTVRGGQDAQPVEGAKVYASWSYGNNVNCTTDENGQCSLKSSTYEGAIMPAMGLTVTDVIHPESLQWTYNSTFNTDPDGDSDGTTLVMSKPVAAPMYVAEMSGVNTASGSKWYTNITVTVRGGQDGQPVEGAKVYASWSYGNNVNCTTDQNGQCSLKSSTYEGAVMPAMSLTITGMTHSEPLMWVYAPEFDTHPDGSDTTTLTMFKP